VASCVTWSGALHSFGIFLPYPITSLATHITKHHTDIYPLSTYVSSFISVTAAVQSALWSPTSQPSGQPTGQRSAQPTVGDNSIPSPYIGGAHMDSRGHRSEVSHYSHYMEWFQGLIRGTYTSDSLSNGRVYSS